MSEFKENITRFIGDAWLTLQEHSPQILLVAGISGVVVSAIMACRATLKVNDILEDAKQEVDEVHNNEVVHAEDTNVSAVSSETTKNLMRVYARLVWKLVKLYGPSVGLMIASILGIIKSESTLQDRNEGLALAAATATANLRQISERARTLLGEEKANEVLYGIEDEKIVELQEGENGETVEVEKVRKTLPKINFNPCVYSIDERCPIWDNDPDSTMYLVRNAEETCNLLARAHGHLFLNDALKELRLPAIKEGQNLGWKFDLKNPSLKNKVTFTVLNESDFVSGRARYLLLEFNCDGDIRNLVWPDEAETTEIVEEERCPFDVR